MKKMNKLGVLIGIWGCICLCGCMSNREKASTHAQKLLEKKYGEKFEVLNMWGNGGKSYYAECYPADDKSLLFEGVFNLEKESFNDEYDEAIFAKKIREIIQPNMEQIFPACYVFPAVISGPSGITDRKKVTIENFVNATKGPRIGFYIGINLDELKAENYQNEYQKITEYMRELEDRGIGMSIGLHFFSKNEYEVFVKESKENSQVSGDLQTIVKKGKEVGFGFVEGAPNISEEEYSRQREEIQRISFEL